MADSIAKVPGQSPGARIGQGEPTLSRARRCTTATLSQAYISLLVVVPAGSTNSVTG